MGYKVINIGNAISFDSIVKCIEKIKPDILFTTFIVGQKVIDMQKFCNDLYNVVKCEIFYGGNPHMLRLIKTNGKVFYTLKEFDQFFLNISSDRIK